MIAIGIDLGNTRSKVAVLEDYLVTEIVYTTTVDVVKIVADLQHKYTATACVICKVVHLQDAAITTLENMFPANFLILSANTILPFDVSYTTPHTLGLDRIALMAAASCLYKYETTLVISTGTCVTYNIIENGKTFLGGAIAPGLQMRLKAMHHFTQQLPLVQNVDKVPLIGNNTESSLQSGAINGLVAEMDGIIEKYHGIYPKFNAVLTGGDMMQLQGQLKSKIFADAHFLFKGLYHLLQFNS